MTWSFNRRASHGATTRRPAALIVPLVTIALTATLVAAPARAASLIAQPKPLPVDGARVVTAGGFVPLDYLRTTLPEVVVSAGALYVPAPTVMIYPGPAVNLVEQRVIRSSSLRSALRSLYIVAKAPARGWGSPNVADAPTTTVTVTVDGHTRSVSVYALGMSLNGPGVSSTQAAARKRLRAAIDRLEALKGKSSIYRPSQLEVWPSLDHIEVTPPEPGLDGGLQFGGDLPWPGPTRPRGCVVLDAGALPATANQATTWTYGDERFGVVFRAVLPGETPCSRDGGGITSP